VAEKEATEAPARVLAKDSSKLKWYIVNTQTSCEAIARNSIEERIRSLRMEEHFGEILIPSENVVELVKGKKATRAKKFFPGYIFVHMNMNDETWHLVKSASKVSGFVGGKVKPPEVPEEEVLRVTRQMALGAEKVQTKVKFTVGENVTVVDGPFSGFNGAVEDINPEKGKVKVLVSIFGRPTPVELDFVQVEKA
jgi:transcriptional antiterminator NusG